MAVTRRHEPIAVDECLLSGIGKRAWEQKYNDVEADDRVGDRSRKPRGNGHSDRKHGGASSVCRTRIRLAKREPHALIPDNDDRSSRYLQASEERVKLLAVRGLLRNVPQKQR